MQAFPFPNQSAALAMGLIKEGDEVRILTDIQAIEDFLGDMDFKVAVPTRHYCFADGHENQRFALRCDSHRHPPSQTRETAHFRKNAGNHRHSPQGNVAVCTAFANPENRSRIYRFGNWPGGKTIKAITEETGVKIDIEDDGTVTIAGNDSEKAQRAYNIVQGMTRKLNAGDVYVGP